MRFARVIFSPFSLALRLILYPLRVALRRRMLKKSGWVEVALSGEVVEHRRASRLPPFVRRMLGREEEPVIELAALRALADELTTDPHAKGLVVDLGTIDGGFASAAQIREQLDRIRRSGRGLLIHVRGHARNLEYLIATAAMRLTLEPGGGIAAVGASAPRLFLKEVLDRAGVKFEVHARGRYKSAPDQFTRTSRGEFDREQTQALVDEIDRALITAIADGRHRTEEEARHLIDGAPYSSSHAVAHGACDSLAVDEKLQDEVKSMIGLEKAPKLVPAGSYLRARRVPHVFHRGKYVGIVEVHGAIVDRAIPVEWANPSIALDAQVIQDLRAAHHDPKVGAVVLHVDSRGGSVTASERILSAVDRLNQEKPVIACFSNVAASGGYFVACGARAIVCSPLTVTGSIGVFAAFPVWPELGARLGFHHEILFNRAHAGFFDPWHERSDEERAHLDREIDGMYEDFLSHVARARKKTRDEVHALAEGRVWTGRAAFERGLVDGTGGMPEAIARARTEADGRFQDDPIVIHARGRQDRPPPPSRTESRKEGLVAILGCALSSASRSDTLVEMLALSLTSTRRPPSIWAYDPIELH